MKSDDEFLTASECTIHHSRSSSYNSANEAIDALSPWWEYGKDDTKENIAKEKMVLAVGLPELPEVDSVLKPSPEVPPGKIVHEVTETTHIKVQHSHNLGVSSYVLTSETVRDKNDEGCTREDVVRIGELKSLETAVPVLKEKEPLDDELLRKLKEVSGDHFEEDALKSYNYVTKHAIKSFF